MKHPLCDADTCGTSDLYFVELAPAGHKFYRLHRS
jgi:hypothetical protein